MESRAALASEGMQWRGVGGATGIVGDRNLPTVVVVVKMVFRTAPFRERGTIVCTDLTTVALLTKFPNAYL